MSRSTPESLRAQALPAGHIVAAEQAMLAAKCGHLQRELDLRDSALDSAASHFMVLDVSTRPWRIVYANQAVAHDHGYERAELLGMDASILASKDDNRPAFTTLGKAVREGASASAELVSRRRDGSTFLVGMHISPLRQHNGAASLYLAIAADITTKLEQERERRALQEQLLNEMQERERIGIELRLAQKLESVGRLAAGIAHEINTPIQYIGDSVSFLESAFSDLDKIRATYQTALAGCGDTAATQAIREEAQAVETAVDLPFLQQEIPRAFSRTLDGVGRVAAIVRAMKEFAHPDSIEQNPADMNHAIETTLLVAHNEYKYTAQVTTHLGLLPDVICNIGEINQVLLNLLVNAAHAIAESGKNIDAGRIDITTRVAGDCVEICVADNGCGIPTAHLEKIFDPFFTTKPVGRGTGQGLAIARAIVVEKHGGRIDVHSQMGEGTRFSLHLPVAGRRGREQ